MANRVRNALAALGLLLVIVTVTPVCRWWAIALAGPYNEPRGDTLIVLGGAAYDDGTLDHNSYLRAIWAVRAWRQGGFRQILLVGGKADTAIPLAEAMRTVLLVGGVPESAIQLETASLTTHENALFTAKLLQSAPGTKVLMTSDYHMFRAARAFAKAGMRVEPRPIPDARSRGSILRSRWGAFSDLASETAKIAYYKLRGWI